ncbi:hypothetical protein PI87_20885 [Ralstonia sp. A12]|uniref:acyltransferase family protein n=1 Tax=Ralstonia sp. A12 TaxID=1217052 RepID=UPI00057339CA|nr:acyltransferase [Ralstonia sp. A12]KHK51615.1 hypothetical protein PI87_20885 [Ralstonia sp. A12]
MSPTVQNRFEGIQALRAIACLLVVLQHVTFWGAFTKGVDDHPLLLINFGRLGVSLFFVISGFVMGYCLDQGKTFLLKRAVRIYPPFWIAIVISFVVLKLAHVDWSLTARSLTLQPSGQINTTYAIPYWTLCYEIAFYVVTYAMVMLGLSRQKMLGVLGAWLLLIVVVDVYRPVGDIDVWSNFLPVLQPGRYILITPYPIFFIVGLFASISMRDLGSRISPTNLMISAILIWAISNGIQFKSAAPMFVMQAVAFSAAILAALRMTFPRFLCKLGDYSYGIYLVHMIFLTAACKAIRHFAPDLPLWACWASMAVLAVGLGSAFGKFEVWLHARIATRLFPKRQASAAVSV